MASKTNVSTSASFAAAAKKIKAMGDPVGAAVGPGVRGIAEEIMTDVKASTEGHGVPVASGALRSTGMVEQPEPLVAELSFGGDAAPYALIQHENLAYHHDIGESRYLVRGVERWAVQGSGAMAALKANAAAGVAAAAKA